MRPHGTVYSASNQTQGEVRIALTEKQKKHYKFVHFIGTNLSSFALAFVIFFYGPQFEMDLNYQAGLAKANIETVSAVESKPDAEIPKPVFADNNFAISIPSIGASAKVLANVNPYDEAEYSKALKEGVAHAKGTALPGEGKRIYLFAHSAGSPLEYAQYNAIFYQLRLLKDGELIFVNYKDEPYIYSVTEKVIVEPNDTGWLTGSSTEEELILQTCDPPGTSLRRLLVIAKRIK